MTKNQQPVEKQAHDQEVDLHSIFRTIQGEGPFSGWSAVFVRLAGCNLQCPLCDTDYTQGRQTVLAEFVLGWIAELQRGGLVVITGGEPFRQPKAFARLCELLVSTGFFVQVETNGTLPPPGGPQYQRRVDHENPRGVYIVVSPKAGKVAEATMHRAAAYKYVLAHDSVNQDDGLPIKALDHSVKSEVARPPRDRKGKPTVPVYIQPCDHQDVIANAFSKDAAVESAMRHGYIFQVQTHKIAGLE